MKTSNSRKIEEVASHLGLTKHCKGLNGMVAKPFEDLFEGPTEPQLHIEGQLNYIAGAKKQIKVYESKICLECNRFSKFRVFLKSRAVKHPCGCCECARCVSERSNGFARPPQSTHVTHGVRIS